MINIGIQFAIGLVIGGAILYAGFFLLILVLGFIVNLFE